MLLYLIAFFSLTVVKHFILTQVYQEICDDLTCFGERIVGEIDNLGRECELHLPSLKCQDAWGNRVDSLETCNAWKQQHAISAEEGLVAIGYERKHNEWRSDLINYVYYSRVFCDKFII